MTDTDEASTTPLQAHTGGAWQTFAQRFLAPLSLSFFGLTAIRVWLQCSIYDRYAFTDSGLVTVVANMTRVVLTLILMTVVARVGFSRRTQGALAACSVVSMTLASALLLFVEETSVTVVLWVACVLAGFGVIWGGGMWITFYERLAARESLFCALVSLGLSCVVGFFLGLVPTTISHLIAMLMPSLSYVMHRSAMSLLDDRGEEGTDGGSISDGRVYDSEPRSTFVRFLMGIALLSLALGFARGFPYGSSIAISLPLQFMHQFGTAALCLAVIWWALVWGRPLHFTALWSILLGLISAGALLLASLEPALMEFGSTLVTVANTFSLGVLWLMSYDVTRHFRVPSYLVLGAVWVAHQLPREVGRLAIIAVGPYDTSPMMVAVFMVAFLAASMLLLVNGSIPVTRPLFTDMAASRDRTDEGRSASERGISGEMAVEGARALGGEGASNSQKMVPPWSKEEEIDASDMALVLMERRYGLTRRETDIARLLVRGLSKGEVGKILCLSESTVRTHARNLYAKLGVHSRQQLTDLVEEFKTS